MLVDFITSLPIVQRFNLIFVIINKLTNIHRGVLCYIITTAEELPYIFDDHI
jgi:hypothetical protein